LAALDINYIIFRNVEIFKKEKTLQKLTKNCEEKNESLRIFLFVEMKISK
jgi:hypothetical protein